MNVEGRQTPGGGRTAKRRRIAIENDSGQNDKNQAVTQKRHRVSRACDVCRSRKDRCDGARPVCSTCAALCRPCSYNSNPRKRGLPTGYLRTLETLWGVVFSRVQGSEEVVRKLLRMANVASYAEDIGKESEGPNVYLSAWKNSAVLKEVEKQLSIVEQPDDDAVGGNYTTANRDFAGNNHESYGSPPQFPKWHIATGAPLSGESPTHGTAPAQDFQRGNPNVGYLMKGKTRDCGIQADTSKSHPGDDHEPRTQQLLSNMMVGAHELELRLPSNAQQLFDIYFSFTHCWFPVLKKHDILRTAFSYNHHAVRVSCHRPGSGDHAVVWAILTFASMQQTSKTSHIGPSGLRNERINSDRLYDTTRRLIPSEDADHEVGHVEALLLLTLVKIGQQKLRGAWVLIGYAIRIALALGLDKSWAANSEPTTQSKNSRGRSQHIFLGCYVLETLVAAKIGCAPLLGKESALRVGPLEEDGLEEWHPWEDKSGLLQVSEPRDFFRQGPLRAMSTFNRFVSLMSILNEFCRSALENSLDLSMLETFEQQLSSWISYLPDSHRVVLQENEPMTTAPHLLGLNLAYESVVSMIQLRGQLLQCHQFPVERQSELSVQESSKRLLGLVQAYVDNYSMSTAPPTFPILLELAYCKPSGSRALSSFLYSEVRLKLQVVSSQLSSAWVSESSSSLADATSNQVTSASTTLPPTERDNHNQATDPSQNLDSMSLQNAIATPAPSYGTAPRCGSSFPPWDTMAVVNAGATPTLQAPRQMEETASQSMGSPDQVFGNLRPTRPSTNYPTSVPHPGHQYSQSYHNSTTNTGPFPSADGNGLSRWNGIPSDLDALFDELSSLEGADR